MRLPFTSNPGSPATPKPDRERLTAADRCDRCPAAARHRVRAPHPHQHHVLDFCGHHWRNYEAALITTGWTNLTSAALPAGHPGT